MNLFTVRIFLKNKTLKIYPVIAINPGESLRKVFQNDICMADISAIMIRSQGTV